MVNGQKTFISNGLLSKLVAHRRQDRPVGRAQGHQPADGRGRHGGLHARAQARQDRPVSADTAELFFEDVRVPRRISSASSIAASTTWCRTCPASGSASRCYALPAARRALDLTKAYAHERTAFGQPIGTFQVNRHFLAEMQTKLDAAQTYLDQCVLSVNDGTLSDRMRPA